FLVLPEFIIAPEKKDRFLEAAMNDARQSLAIEIGCLQFDVTCLEGDTVLFYEVYSGRAAFDHHLETSHFKEFQDAMKRLNIAEPDVRFGKRTPPKTFDAPERETLRSEKPGSLLSGM